MREMQKDTRHDVLASLRRLSDSELIARVKRLAARERRASALLVAHLAELGTRDVHLRAGFSSLFVYCRDALAFSEHEAYNRVEVARAARRFPVILELLAAGSVNLTTVRLLGPHLTPENHDRVLESARGKRKAEVEEIVARLAPFPEVPAFIRKLPAAKPALPPPDARGPAGQVAAFASAPATPTAPVAATPPFQHQWPSGEVTPLAPDRYKLQLTIGGSTLEKLRLAKDMLRHAIPSGDDAAILDRAFTALLVDLARSKFAATENPHPPRAAAAGSRHIPAEVKRAVWLRDLGRCAFVGSDGRRCNERAFVEFHHVRPYAAGGCASVENIQLRCRRHNDYEARAYFAQGGVGDTGGFVRERSGGAWPPSGAWPSRARATARRT